ncbi:Replication initiator protein A [Paenibacillus sp. 1_12]|uniref:replication initiator protein A n=1 Tax=Paenibacillus sp. 1_12 TaxID=1566278 RepID=UPI0008EDAF01|nr:replication initiator protein A [Paenibacillus sp. 1_12]SFK97906.1 Replication initiator protein A [Paenibacillus sp. 1_12]
MSKAIINVLEKYAPKLIDLKKQLKSVSSDEKMIMGQLDEEINGYSSSLINKKIYELKRISGKIVETRNDISQKILMNLENHSTPTEELFEQQEYLEMQILILEKAIQRKQEQNRQFSHSVERNFIDHPFISSTTPNESTLKLRRNQKGILELNKTGFRNLFYQNSNGTLLLPYDARNLFGVFKMWEQKGKAKEFEFAFKELLHNVNADINGGEYDTLHTSLDNLGKTSIVMEEFYDAEAKKRRRTKIHNPFQDVDIDRDTNTVFIRLSDDLYKNLLAGNVVSISISLFNDLATPTSKNLYLIVVNKTKDREFVLEVEALINHLGLNTNDNYKAYVMLKNSFDELQNFDVIRNYEIVKKGRVPVKVIFEPSEWLQKATDTIEERLLI